MYLECRYIISLPHFNQLRRFSTESNGFVSKKIVTTLNLNCPPPARFGVQKGFGHAGSAFSPVSYENRCQQGWTHTAVVATCGWPGSDWQKKGRFWNSKDSTTNWHDWRRNLDMHSLDPIKLNYSILLGSNNYWIFLVVLVWFNWVLFFSRHLLARRWNFSAESRHG